MSEALVKLTHDSEELHQSISFHLNNIEKDTAQAIDILATLITAFELQPLLLDPHLASYVHTLCDTFQRAKANRSSLKVIYEAIGAVLVMFANVRGYVALIPYFSADVYQLECLVDYVTTGPSPNALVVPFMWICNLVMVPFDLSTLKANMVTELYNIATSVINNTPPGLALQKIILIMMARLLRRFDTIETLLPRYLSYLVDEWSAFRSDVKIGHYMVLNRVLKESVTSDLCLTVSSFIKVDLKEAPSNLFQLFRTKILTQLAVIHTRQKDYEAVSEITNDLTEILNNVDYLDENSRYAWAKGLAMYTQELGKMASNYQDQLIQHIYVQLPSELSTGSIPIQKLHAILLYFGFLTLENVLPGSWMGHLIKIAQKYLYFERHFFRSNVGTIIRDALNFILWAISRVRNQKLISSGQLKDAFEDLIRVSVTDSELMVRRGAIAVVQEMLGRSGSRILDVPSDKLGELVIEIVEKVNTLAVLTLGSLYKLIPYLESIGYSFQNILLEKMQPNVDWRQQKLASCYITWDHLVVKNIRYDRDNLYCVCYGLRVLGVTQPNAAIDKLGMLFKFDGDSVSQAAGYLSWCILRKTYDLEEIRSIVSSSKAHEIEDCLRTFCCVLSKTLLSEMISLIPFLPVLARVIFETEMSPTTMENVMKLAFDTKMDIDVRVAIALASPWISDYTNLLDDYTTTIHGDVGQKLRAAILLRLKKEYDNFTESTRGRLIRLMCEPVDKVAKLAKSLLCFDDVWGHYSIMTSSEKLEFWKGMIMSIGGYSVASKTVNDNLNKFFDLYLSEFQWEILQYLLELGPYQLEPRSRIVAALSTWRRLLEAGLPIPKSFEWRPLLKDVYNLHINTREWMRVEAAIRLFGKLLFVKDGYVREKVVERLLVLLHHRQSRIRACVNDTLAEIVINHEGTATILDQINQSTPLSEQLDQLRYLLVKANY